MDAETGTPVDNNVTPVGKQLVSINMLIVVYSDQQAMDIKRRVTDAVAGCNKLRNTFSINDVPPQGLPPTM